MDTLLYIARRVLLLAIVLWVVSVGIFTIVQVLPGDVAVMILGTSATPGDLAALRQQMGLNEPALHRYFAWISGFLRGDWGNSILYTIPVRNLVVERLGYSVLLGGCALFLVVPLAIALGVVSAARRNQPVDYAIGISTLIAVSLPEFITGTVLILLFAYLLPILPPASMIDSRSGLGRTMAALVLPTLTLVLVLLAHMTRMVRATMIEVLQRPYVRAARLKGLSSRAVLLRHALRNAMLPTVGIIAINVGYLIGGVVVVETVFAYPGLGRLIVHAITHRDVPVIQVVTLLVATIYCSANLAADISYFYLDPRIRR